METSSVNQHDVFIDFSSKDTRYSFISHLSAAFHRRNITTFLGEDSISSVTQSAIEGAKVFVVVFSENYASSPLCLETLVKCLDLQRRDNGLVVIPVFYGDVTPSIVKEQTDKYGAAFSEHRSLFTEDDRVERWRNGLIEAAKLQGHESNEQENDSDLVEEIVADVREKLYPTGKIGFYLRLVGIENLLCKQSHDFYRLGILGMPGIGKTTIAQAVSNQMSHDFETLCFLQDFHVKFHEKGLRVLREEYLVEKLRETKVLLVLDDVRNPMEAESFLGGFDCFRPGSLIIITSRDKQVLYQCQVDGVYEVPSLNKKEALQLFNRFAFPTKKTSDGVLVEVSKKVVEYANGNPSALCFYGRELEERTELDEMEADFEKLKQYPPREIIDVFKSSYDVLIDNERSIFLDIACFFNGEQLDQIMRIFEGCGFFPHVGIERLVERSLLVISKKKKVEMHNLIQDVAREIVNEENNQIMRRRRLWDPSSIRVLLEDNDPEGTEVIEGIFFDTTNLNVVVNPMALNNMYNLRLLKIYSSNSETAQEVNLPDGLESLPYELRLLHWEKYPLQSLPEDFDPGHLVELNMPYSQLQSLWGGTESLASLKIINLSHSKKIVEVDELSKACSIEQIHLQGCTSLKSIPETGRLKNLQHLNLSGCTRIERAEITKKIKGLDLEGGLRETKSESMVFSMLVELEPQDSF
ncbi:unnamed protein product [Microthlaspi erraticum]|uniref:TIR domain-containing protein n=1 Tax=Microthlaspi erraticum TaxID=1685480 RepID=A0A6D2LCB0_9BRAS|nr:unnamed protein product [Microthlaspi erraticum]